MSQTRSNAAAVSVKDAAAAAVTCLTVRFPFCRANAFTRNPFGGNPAAIVLLDSIQHQNGAQAADYFNNSDWCAAVAKELELAETAFLLPGFHIPPSSSASASSSFSADAASYSTLPNVFSIRWFALNGKEERLCGHATLASAHFLYTSSVASPSSPIHFYSHISGPLTAHRDSTDSDCYLLDFPAKPSINNFSPQKFIHHKEVVKALGIEEEDVLAYDESELDLIIEVKHDNIVIQANSVDFSALGALPRYRGFLLTSSASVGRVYSSSEIDFVSRCYFHGVGEDSATGSAHCALLLYWKDKKPARICKSGKQWWNAYQASKRGALLKLGFEEDKQKGTKRVVLKGNAVNLIEGHIVLPSLTSSQ